MHKREQRFVQREGDTWFDRGRAGRRSRHKLEAHGIIICMKLVIREGLTNTQMRWIADTLRYAGFVALVERPDSIRLHSEPGLAMAFMARADKRGLLGRRFRRDLGGLIRDRSLIRQELRDRVAERLERIFMSIASVEPPQQGDWALTT